MEKTYIKSEKSVTLDPPPLLAAKRKNTQRILLAIVLLIGLTSAVIGMAIPCAFPDLFLNIPPRSTTHWPESLTCGRATGRDRPPPRSRQ